MREYLTASLNRLNTNYVDIYYLHRFNPDIQIEDIATVMGKFIREGLIRGWGLSQVDVDVIERANEVTPLSAVQNIYSMLERGIEKAVIPYCMEHHIGIVPFSPIASGFLSGKIAADSDFSHSDDVRKYVPQLSLENMAANQSILDLLDLYAKQKHATKAQISLSWMLHKYPNVVPIPGSKNQERILENLSAWNVTLTPIEFAKLESALEQITVHGHRGFVEQQGGSMKDWGRK